MIPKYRMWLKCAELMQRVHSINFYQETAEWIFHDLVNQKEVIEEELFDNIILMQSTGLHDKNGIEIYEGDIVKNSYGEIGYIKHSIYTFVFAKKKECEWREFYLHGIGAGSPFEVLGNVHEHPELLN